MTVVAYLVTSHRLPGQVVRLARTLRELSPSAPLLVHHDGRREPVDGTALRRLGVRLVPPEPTVEWGRGSQLDMLLRCLRFALQEVEFDWLALVSGQDYPARPLADVERDLAATAFDGFVEGHPVAPPPWSREPADEFSRRYFMAWRPVRDPGAAGRRALAAARPLLAVREVPSGTLLGRRCRTPFGPDLPCRRGSDWLTLSRRAVQAVDRAARERPELVRHFRRTVLPTEAFPHTVLHARSDLRLSGDHRRIMRWDAARAHPRTLRLEDLDLVLHSGADFARKFDVTVDARILDGIDRAIGVPDRSAR